tara:strand:- start:181 stop:762 length:582 start_codon:yes stop_codon:yes gene_type:complete
MKPGQKLIKSKKTKPWYYNMAEYKPEYINDKDGNRVQTHGFYRPEDEEMIPYAGEKNVLEVMKMLNINKIEDTKEYRDMQKKLEGPALQHGIDIKSNIFYSAGKRRIVNEASEDEGYFDYKNAPHTPEFTDMNQLEHVRKRTAEAKENNHPVMTLDNTALRKDYYDKNRKVFQEFLKDVSTKAFKSSRRNAKR